MMTLGDFQSQLAGLLHRSMVAGLTKEDIAAAVAEELKAMATIDQEALMRRGQAPRGAGVGVEGDAISAFKTRLRSVFEKFASDIEASVRTTVGEGATVAEIQQALADVLAEPTALADVERLRAAVREAATRQG